MQTEVRFYPYDKRNQESAKIADRLPFASARGCTQRLECTTDPKLYRTIQGRHISFQQEGYGKYVSILTCQDVCPAAFNGLWPGQSLTIECLAFLMTAQGEKGEKVSFDRPPVKNALRLYTPDGQWHALEDVLLEGQALILPEKGYVAYRPLLHMIVQSTEQECSEWENKTKWTLKSIEI